MFSLGNIFSVFFWMAIGFTVVELKTLEHEMGVLSIKAYRKGFISLTEYHEKLSPQK